MLRCVGVERRGGAVIFSERAIFRAWVFGTLGLGFGVCSMHK